MQVFMPIAPSVWLLRQLKVDEQIEICLYFYVTPEHLAKLLRKCFMCSPLLTTFYANSTIWLVAMATRGLKIENIFYKFTSKLKYR